MKHLITRTRIIGIAVLIVAILAYYAGWANGIPFGIMGLILILAPTKYGQHMYDLLTESFSKWKTIITTALYDSIYWLIIAGAIYFYAWRVNIKAAIAQASSTLTKTAMMNPEIVSGNLDQLKGFVYQLIIGAILLLILGFIVYNIFRGLTWTTITGQKLNKQFYKKFFLVNAGWWAVWLPLFILIAFALNNKPEAKQGIAGLLFITFYFTPIMHTLYMQTHKIGQSIGNGIGWGIAKIHRLIVPYIFALVIYVIVYQVFRPIQATQFMQPASMLFVVLFLAWLRVYLYEVIKEFK